jgi:hypothetical protein
VEHRREMEDNLEDTKIVEKGRSSTFVFTEDKEDLFTNIWVLGRKG